MGVRSHLPADLPDRKSRRLGDRVAGAAHRGARVAAVPCLLLAGACGESGTAPEPAFTVTITHAPEAVRQGDVTDLRATVRDASGAPAEEVEVDWSLEPSTGGLIGSDGRLVAYDVGAVRVVARVPGGRDEVSVSVSPRQRSGSFRVLGHGAVDDRFTSDLWLFGDFAYTGTWGSRQVGEELNRGDRLHVWDVADPAAPRLADAVVVEATTVNDVKIRADGTLAVLTHEGSPPNGITLLDLSDPLQPTPISRFSERLATGVHNVWIEGNYVYAVADGTDPSLGAGLNIVDVTDPANPSLAASFFGGAAAASGQFAHDVYVRDGLAFLSHWNVGLVILDVGHGIAGGSPGNPVEVSRIETAGGQVHNAWYWPDAGHVFVGEEDFDTPGSVHVVDVRDLRAPREVASYSVPGSTPHNFWVDETREILLVGWYTQGVRALDVSGALLGALDRQGREIASLLYDGSGQCASGFGTCTWAPQLHDGRVWVSDMNSGLWSLELELDGSP